MAFGRHRVFGIGRLLKVVNYVTCVLRLIDGSLCLGSGVNG